MGEKNRPLTFSMGDLQDPIYWRHRFHIFLAYFSLNFREYPQNSYGQKYGTKLVPPSLDPGLLDPGDLPLMTWVAWVTCVRCRGKVRAPWNLGGVRWIPWAAPRTTRYEWRAGDGRPLFIDWLVVSVTRDYRDLTWYNYSVYIYMYLIGGFKHDFYFSMIYGMSSQPHWRTPSFFRGVGQPPTSLACVQHVPIGFWFWLFPVAWRRGWTQRWIHEFGWILFEVLFRLEGWEEVYRVEWREHLGAMGIHMYSYSL